MLKRLFTLLFGSETPKEPEPETLRKRVQRLEIDFAEQQERQEAVWARMRKVEGFVHGHRGADARHPQRLRRDHSEETIDEFRDRMAREGRLKATMNGESHGEPN